jgi:hypothetical protein
MAAAVTGSGSSAAKEEKADERVSYKPIDGADGYSLEHVLSSGGATGFTYDDL